MKADRELYSRLEDIHFEYERMHTKTEKMLRNIKILRNVAHSEILG